MENFYSLLIYAGAALTLAGLVSLVKPLRLLAIRSRRAAGLVLGFGLALVLFGAALPARLERSSEPRTRLDDFLPAYQFREFHSVRIHAPPQRVYEAVQSVTAGEIRFFRLLTWIRSPRLTRARRENILAAPPEKPLLDVALHSGFLLLAREPDREIVFGTVLCRRIAVADPRPEDFLRLDGPGYCKTAMNFRMREEPGGSVLLSTETRVFATDPPARRAFAVYWRVIAPGSALIRRSWLGAIKRRAEKA